MVPQYRSVRDSGVASVTGKSNLQMLHDLRFEYPKNLLCGYLCGYAVCCVAICVAMLFAVWLSEYK